MQDVLDQLTDSTPKLIGALVILIVGWIVAKIASRVAREALRRTQLDDRIAQKVQGSDRGEAVDVAPMVGTVVFWGIMLFVLIGFFQTLNMTIVTEPLNRLLSQIFEFIPQLLAAALLFVVAWLLATLVRRLLLQLFGAVQLDERLGSSADPSDAQAEDVPASRSIAEAAYWLIFLLFLPAILGALGLTGLLGPVQNLVDELLTFLPNLFAAGLILVIGWFLARIIQRVVTNLLAAIGLDRFSERVGVAQALGGQRLSALTGLVVFVLILIPVVISALQALSLSSVTVPATNMLNSILAKIPDIFGAALTLIIAYFIGRILATVVTNILAGVGANTLPSRLGFTRSATDEPTLSVIGGWLVLVAIMLFALIAALDSLGFGAVANLVFQFTELLGHIALGVIIFAIGLYLARIAAGAVRGSGIANAGLLAQVTQVAILVLAGAMGLRQMGIANSIINLAFGLFLGAVAVAAAIAFGLGGREVAGRQLNRLVERTREGGAPSSGGTAGE